MLMHLSLSEQSAWKRNAVLGFEREGKVLLSFWTWTGFTQAIVFLKVAQI